MDTSNWVSNLVYTQPSPASADVQTNEIGETNETNETKPRRMRFTLQLGLTMSKVCDDARGEADTLTKFFVVGEDDPVASFHSFLGAVSALSVDGVMPGSIVVMKDVGACIRDADGNQVRSPNGLNHAPFICSPCNDPSKIYAAFDEDTVATCCAP